MLKKMIMSVVPIARLDKEDAQKVLQNGFIVVNFILNKNRIDWLFFSASYIGGNIIGIKANYLLWLNFAIKN